MRALGGVTGSSGGNVRAMLLPAPVDYDTRIAGLNLVFYSPEVRWQLGYTGSFFSNGTNALQWPTAFTAHPQWGPGVGYPDGQNQMALEPDNQNINGSAVLGDTCIGKIKGIS